jgi:hypothetical protein
LPGLGNAHPFEPAVRQFVSSIVLMAAVEIMTTG